MFLCAFSTVGPSFMYREDHVPVDTPVTPHFKSVALSSVRP